MTKLHSGFHEAYSSRFSRNDASTVVVLFLFRRFQSHWQAALFDFFGPGIALQRLVCFDEFVRALASPLIKAIFDSSIDFVYRNASIRSHTASFFLNAVPVD